MGPRMISIDRERLFLLAFLDALGILWPLFYLLLVWGSRERKGEPVGSEGGPIGLEGARMAGIQVKPEPWCPECGAKMRLRRPKKGQDWQPFWGCSQYPDCEGTRGIAEDGTPVYNEENLS